jgi:hypothetical protein
VPEPETTVFLDQAVPISTTLDTREDDLPAPVVRNKEDSADDPDTSKDTQDDTASLAGT